MKVVIANVFADDNAGSAALTWAAIEIAKATYPEASVALVPVASATAPRHALRRTIDRYPDVEVLEPLVAYRDGNRAGLGMLARLLWLLLVGGRSRRRTARRLADADLVLSRGGYVFVERSSIAALLSFLLTTSPLVYAMRIGQPVVVLPTSIGPFRTGHAKRASGALLRRAAHVFARDPISFEVAQQLNVKPHRLSVTADSVFALSPSLGGRRGCVADRRDARRTVVLTARGLTDSVDEAVQQEVARAIVTAIEQGLLDRAVVAVQSHGPDVSDLEASRCLARHLQRVPYQLLEPMGPEQLVQLYGTASIVLTQHLHSCVFSIIAGTPALGLSTDGAKMEGVFLERGFDPAMHVLRRSAGAEEVVDGMRQLLQGSEVGPLRNAFPASDDYLAAFSSHLASIQRLPPGEVASSP